MKYTKAMQRYVLESIQRSPPVTVHCIYDVRDINLQHVTGRKAKILTHKKYVKRRANMAMPSLSYDPATEREM